MRKQERDKNKFILGITGSFGSGKTTVARMFKSFGAQIIDADKLAHRSLKHSSPAFKRIIATFGDVILKNNIKIDRKKLSEAVFNNKDLLFKLNSIIHPEVIRAIRLSIKHSKSRLIVLDAPLLLEAGLEKLVDKLIVVKITRAKQIKRIKKRMSLGQKDILKRIRAQIPLRNKVRLADFVIDNNGTVGETRRQVEKIWRSLVPDTLVCGSSGLRRLVWKN